MAKIQVPTNFNSFEEYDTYFTCIKKVQVGDKVEAYFKRNVADDPRVLMPSRIASDITKEVLVAGIRYSDHSKNGRDKFSIALLLSSNDECLGFYRPSQDIIDEYKIKQLYMYWGHVRDIKFKKIIKLK